MKYCPAIVGLKLDEKSLIAIDNINDIHNVMKLGKVTILIGQLLSIFAGNAVKTSSSGIRLMEDTLAWRVVSSNQAQNGWAITQSNWEYFFSSFGSLDRHGRRQIETIAGIEAYRTWEDPKQQVFWRSIHDGCKVK
ncbi:hypothetical protein [Shewanella sp. OMA3-2]|uniref:hypothetical protein n=1 Tax=Shewanella sp. OMA3-2 TaxID=2908650 RepID=UPI001F1FC479|nr:hypothetical protein [Shewanella sp. OMA3-2]UJF21927.1 hypothetical protein L0B17_00135 [Shewanella sp. OMA3-2]